jgi:flagellar basal body-associated protein FliL
MGAIYSHQATHSVSTDAPKSDEKKSLTSRHWIAIGASCGVLVAIVVAAALLLVRRKQSTAAARNASSEPWLPEGNTASVDDSML